MFSGLAFQYIDVVSLTPCFLFSVDLKVLFAGKRDDNDVDVTVDTEAK